MRKIEQLLRPPAGLEAFFRQGDQVRTLPVLALALVKDAGEEFLRTIVSSPFEYMFAEDDEDFLGVLLPNEAGRRAFLISEGVEETEE
jgi:hypothetical protein